jgi:hypothetical protein
MTLRIAYSSISYHDEVERTLFTKAFIQPVETISRNVSIIAQANHIPISTTAQSTPMKELSK